MKQALLLLLAWVGTAGTAVATADAERTAEAERLRTHAQGLAIREGKQLVLSLTGKRTPLVLTDQPDCERANSCLLHRWSGLRIGQRFHEVSTQFYEGGRWLWIDRGSAQRTEMEGRPLPAPGGRHVLAVSEAEAYERQGLWLWAVTPQGLSPRFAYVDEPFRVVAWETAFRARVLRLSYDAQGCASGVRGQPHRLVIEPSGGVMLERLFEPAVCASN